MTRPSLCCRTVLVVTVASVLVACGGGGGEEPAPGEGAAAAERPCAPIGEELAAQADTTVDIDLAEYAFEPSEVGADAGVITFATSNVGAEAHELAFLPGGGDVPFTGQGVPDEDALAEAGAFELEAYGPGGSCDATYELGPGTYTMFCIVAAADGETHYDKGMRGTLTVR